MVIQVKKAGKAVVTFCIIWSIIQDALIAELHFPSSISYLVDFAVGILLLLLIHERGKDDTKEYSHLAFIVVLYSVSLLFGLVGNGVDIKLLLWAIRNTYRFYIFFFACVKFYDYTDVERIISKMYVLNIISLILALYQFLVLGHAMDYVGGIFGYGNGAALNTFNALLVSIYFCMYMKKRASLFQVMVVIGSSCLISAIAEEKAFFLYLSVIIVVYLISNRASFKTIAIAVVVSTIMLFAIQYLYATNEWLTRRDMFTIDAYVQYARESYGIDRLNPFGDINEKFFKDDVLLNLFGYGFGNCELSTGGAALTSSFAKQNYGYQYYDFVSQMRFLETGYVGIITYVLFFVYILIVAIRNRNSTSSLLALYSSITICYTSVVIISIWMSQALRAKEAYIIFFGLAMLLILRKNIQFSEITEEAL